MKKTADPKKYHQAYAKENRHKIRKNRRDWVRRINEETLKHYGGSCKCCKEHLLEFLGMYPNKGIPMPPTRQSLSYWLWTNEFPEGFQVLCKNCGYGFDRLGYCPHTQGVV